MIRFALVVASVLGFLLTAALGNLIVPLRRAFRPDEAEQKQVSPQQKSEEEQEPRPAPQPPALGGLCLMVGALAASGVGWTAACVADTELLASRLTTRLVVALGGALLFGAIGVADDVLRARTRAPLGLRRAPRLALEVCAAGLFLAWTSANGWLVTGASLPGGVWLEFGAAAPVVWGLGLVALAECARVSDGADGSLCGAAFVAMLGLMCVLTQLGWFPLAVFPAALAGALMAFLLWNFPPAKLRPGMAGCLFLGGAIGCVSLCVGRPEAAVPLALPFWLEGGMVALQIVYHKLARGRLLFRAAPLHRWLEKRGLGAVGIFYVFCALALAGFVLAVQLVRMT